MKDSKLVSVIVPIYNAEIYLDNLFADLTGQSYQHMEILAIDDGSTDHSWEKLTEFSKKDTRIKAVHTDNFGPSHARNVGLDAATGEYIRFVDADDRLPLTAMETMVRALEEKEQIDLVIGNYASVPETKYFKGDGLQNAAVDMKTFTQEYVKHIKAFYYGVAWNKLYRRELIEQNKIRFPEDINWCEDLFFNLDYYACCKQVYICAIPEGIYTYYQREHSITSGISVHTDEKAQYIEQLRYKRVIDFCRMYGLDDEARIQWECSDLYVELAYAVKSQKPLSNRYADFKELLGKKEVYQYLLENREQYKIIKFLEYTVRRRMYWIAFSFFIGKGMAGRMLGKITPDIREKIQRYLPTQL